MSFDPQGKIERARIAGALQTLDWLTCRAGSAIRDGDMKKLGFAFGKMIAAACVLAAVVERV